MSDYKTLITIFLMIFYIAVLCLIASLMQQRFKDIWEKFNRVVEFFNNGKIEVDYKLSEMQKQISDIKEDIGFVKGRIKE